MGVYGSVLGANEEYVEQARKYGKKDVHNAMLLYIIIIAMSIIAGFVIKEYEGRLARILLSMISCLPYIGMMGLVWFFCKRNHQSKETVGISKRNLKPSLIVGTICFGLVAVFSLIQALFGQKLQIQYNHLFYRIIYYAVFVAFTEELVFRGYIGTRLYGYCRNKWLSVVITGILFSLLHIPFTYIVSGQSFAEFSGGIIATFCFTFLFHLISQWLYSKYNNIAAPTMLHFAWDFFLWFFCIS